MGAGALVGMDAATSVEDQRLRESAVYPGSRLGWLWR